MYTVGFMCLDFSLSDEVAVALREQGLSAVRYAGSPIRPASTCNEEDTAGPLYGFKPGGPVQETRTFRVGHRTKKVQLSPAATDRSRRQLAAG
jgi:hypothetical protein